MQTKLNQPFRLISLDRSAVKPENLSLKFQHFNILTFQNLKKMQKKFKNQVLCENLCSKHLVLSHSKQQRLIVKKNDKIIKTNLRWFCGLHVSRMQM